MTTNRTLSIHQPEDILGYIPHMLGYWPEDSLVAITMQGKLIGATLRVDLPALSPSDGLACFAEQILSYLVADEAANGVILAVYTADGWNDGAVVQRTAPLLNALRASLDRAGLIVRDAWLVGAEYWRGAYCEDAGCCPVPGFPVERIKESRLSTELVYRGSAVGPSPAKGVEGLCLARPGAHEPRVLEAEDMFGERVLPQWRSEACFDAVLAVWRHVVDRHRQGDPLNPADDAGLMGFLRTTLKIPAWRDAVVVMAAAGIGAAKSGASGFGFFTDDVADGELFDPSEVGVDPFETIDQVAAGGDEPRDVYTYGDVLLGMHPELPCWKDLDALQQVLAGLSVDNELGEVAASALTLQGWIFWCKGMGTFAHACLTRAEEAHPGYRLAELLMGILGQGAICGWARRPGSAWKGPRNAPV
ncbi:DUF4192 domain-containing protein [Paenarthrobacter sp. JL.01a]|uniref:DUF4192 domain-containing protein n=1 Tax=Paenarthrobacter sp. JL.01a TaxID=2979324 RepID=UPI0021C86C0F|nr:DUF4192 domain-containing protein [Paenarthrobacter sp. JL.01a]UXM93394.1 DUF4192 domain-containing protein [Paenarthrobacter sp. JL.01a]